MAVIFCLIILCLIVTICILYLTEKSIDRTKKGKCFAITLITVFVGLALFILISLLCGTKVTEVYDEFKYENGKYIIDDYDINIKDVTIVESDTKSGYEITVTYLKLLLGTPYDKKVSVKFYVPVGTIGNTSREVS